MAERKNRLLFMTLLVIMVTDAFAQSVWTLRNPLPTDNALRSVTWTGTQLVAVGQGGLFLTSPDGIHWTNRNAGTSNTLYSVAWTETQFVVVGGGGAILTSPNDPAWISPSPRIQSGLSLYMTPSHLLITPPYSLIGQKIRASICTLTGGKVVEVWAGADREIKIPIENLARGRYVFELQGAGLRMAKSFEMVR